MADVRTGVGKIKDEPGTSCGARKQGSAQRTMGMYSKDTGASWEVFPLLKSSTRAASE